MKFAWVFLAFLLAGGIARAGIYNTTDIYGETGDEFRLTPNVFKFRATLAIVRSIGFDKIEKDNLLRKRYFLNEALGGRQAVRAIV